MTALNKRGVQEGMANLAELRNLLEGLASDAERQVAEAEGRLLAYRKLAGFVDLQAWQYREALDMIEAAEQERA